MPTRDRGSDDDDTPLGKIVARLVLMEEVIAAQARSMRDLTIEIKESQDAIKIVQVVQKEFQSAIAIVQAIQDDFRTQRATREAWAQIMKTVQWFVVVMAAAVGAVAAYIGMHAGK
jgi:hypothetical protein